MTTSKSKNIDPALAEHLEELTDIANEIGAEGIWLIRGARNATLTYTPEGTVEQPGIPGVAVTMNLNLSLELTDAGVLVIIRFPAGDGREAGIEYK